MLGRANFVVLAGYHWRGGLSALDAAVIRPRRFSGQSILLLLLPE